MRLIKLLHCDIYRDGGSLEGTWLTDENQEWSITLRINHWDRPDEIMTYNLFNFPLDQIEQNQQILKDSSEHNQVMTLINNWILENNIQLTDIEKEENNYGRLDDLLIELDKGNF